jgi:hypothetical protein
VQVQRPQSHKRLPRYSEPAHQDFYGNSLAGPYTQLNSATWPYTTAFNPIGAVSIPQQIVIASTNAVDNEATQVRTNTTLHPFIYDIALMGNGPPDDMPDPLLLQKIANDPALAGDTGRSTSRIGLTFYQQQINQPHGRRGAISRSGAG